MVVPISLKNRWIEVLRKFALAHFQNRLNAKLSKSNSQLIILFIQMSGAIPPASQQQLNSSIEYQTLSGPTAYLITINLAI